MNIVEKQKAGIARLKRAKPDPDLLGVSLSQSWVRNLSPSVCQRARGSWGLSLSLVPTTKFEQAKEREALLLVRAVSRGGVRKKLGVWKTGPPKR